MSQPSISDTNLGLKHLGLVKTERDNTYASGPKDDDFARLGSGLIDCSHGDGAWSLMSAAAGPKE